VIQHKFLLILKLKIRMIYSFVKHWPTLKNLLPRKSNVLQYLDTRLVVLKRNYQVILQKCHKMGDRNFTNIGPKLICLGCGSALKVEKLTNRL